MKKFPLILVFLIFIMLTACTPGQNTKTLKIAVLPILDSVPLYVAQSEGMFKRHDVQVELIPVASAPERDQLMQSGQIDGMLNEIGSTILFNRDETRVVILRFARVATHQGCLFRILAAKDSGIQDVEDLRDVPIAISEGTIIEYTTDRILEKAGLRPDEIQKVNVPKIPDRLALLGAGELKAANLPDPMASLAIQEGAINVIDDTFYPEVSNSVWTFKVATVKEHPEQIRRFMAAVEDAIDDINANKGKWSGLVTELKFVPPTLLGKYIIPDYPKAAIPDEAQFADSAAWLKSKGLIQKDPVYQEMVDPSFLPNTSVE